MGAILIAGLGLLGPWPLKILFDSVLGNHPVPEIVEPYTRRRVLVLEFMEGTKIDRDWLWFSDGASKDQSTDTYVTFTLKPQKHVSLELGLKPNKPKGVRPR